MGDENWVNLGRWVEPVLFSTPFLTVANTPIGKKYFSGIKCEMMLLWGHYFELKSFQEGISRVFDEDENFSTDLIEFSKQQTDEMLDKKDDFEGFIRLIDDFLGVNFIYELYDHYLVKKLQTLCEKHNIPMDEVMMHMTPPRKTLLMKYNEELRNVEDIDAFVKKWKWVGTHALQGEGLTRKEVEESMGTEEQKIEVKEAIFPEEIQKLIPIGSELSFLRSNRIEVIDMVAFGLRDKMTSFAKEHGMNYQELTFYTAKEIIKLIETGEKTEVKDRIPKYGVIFSNKEFNFMSEEELDKKLESLLTEATGSEIKGLAAYRGVVKGEVKLVFNKEDCEKVNDGDILVAMHTLPHYIMAMKRAAAFVTDLGGITSHASIIAREMKKPCIIGTQVGTKLLKDGDMVEVDADNGVVRKVS